MGDFNKEITDYKEKTKNLKEVEEKMTKLESTMQELVDKQVKNKEESLNSAFTEQLKTFEEEKDRNAKKLVEAESKVKQLQVLLDENQSELYDLKSRHDDKRNTISDEM